MTTLRRWHVIVFFIGLLTAVAVDDFRKGEVAHDVATEFKELSLADLLPEDRIWTFRDAAGNEGLVEGDVADSNELVLTWPGGKIRYDNPDCDGSCGAEPVVAADVADVNTGLGGTRYGSSEDRALLKALGDVVADAAKPTADKVWTLGEAEWTLSEAEPMTLVVGDKDGVVEIETLRVKNLEIVDSLEFGWELHSKSEEALAKAASQPEHECTVSLEWYHVVILIIWFLLFFGAGYVTAWYFPPGREEDECEHCRRRANVDKMMDEV